MAHFSVTVVDRLSCRCVLPGWLSLRCHIASMDWRLPVALGPSSPTTFYPCGLQRPSPDALCVFRPLLEGPEEATPSIRRLAWQARKFNGPPPPVPRPKLDYPTTGFQPPEGRSARGFKPPAFSRFLFQSAVESAETF